MSDALRYRVLLDSEWSLQDWSDFPYLLSQAYAFSYFFDTDVETLDKSRIDLAVSNYPWAGGYSVTNMYRLLQSQMPPGTRPAIAAVRYESPGWMDIMLNSDAIRSVATSVGVIAGSAPLVLKIVTGVPVVTAAIAGTTKGIASIAKSAEACAKHYDAIQKILQDINARRRNSELQKIQATAREAEEISKLVNSLAKTIGFKGYKDLIESTGSEEAAAKALMAHFRRLRDIAKFVEDKKVQLPIPSE